MTAQSIVSLLPSTTEIVYALGLEADLVAVTFECDEPVSARQDKAVVVGGVATEGLAPAAIDELVRDRLARGVDLYTLDAGALSALDPDLILTQDLCRVCAIATDRVDVALAQLGCSAEVLSVDPYSLEDVLSSIQQVADAAGVPDRGQDLVSRLRRRIEAVDALVGGRPRPRVAVIEWVDPLFNGGHWIPDLVEAAGGTAVGGHPHVRSAPSQWQELRSAAPEVAVVAPCGFGLDAAAEQASLVAEQLPGAAVWAIDADGLVVRPGPRLVDGIEALASILHPDVVEPRRSVRRVVR